LTFRPPPTPVAPSRPFSRASGQLRFCFFHTSLPSSLVVHSEGSCSFSCSFGEPIVFSVGLVWGVIVHFDGISHFPFAFRRFFFFVDVFVFTPVYFPWLFCLRSVTLFLVSTPLPCGFSTRILLCDLLFFLAMFYLVQSFHLFFLGIPEPTVPNGILFFSLLHPNPPQRSSLPFSLIADAPAVVLSHFQDFSSHIPPRPSLHSEFFPSD